MEANEATQKEASTDSKASEIKNPDDRGKIVFYCKDCEKLVDVDRIGIKYSYKCKTCKSKAVAFGTEASLKKLFHIQEEAIVAAK